MNYIGIDGGGTKTKFTLVNEQLMKLDSYTTTTCHFAQVGFKGLKEVLEEGIHYLVHKHSLSEYAIAYGLAGYGREQSIRKEIETVVKQLSNDHPYILVNDVQSAIAGALNLCDGIAVIAGTGSIAVAKHGDEMVRCGGWGYFLGDEGSGTWIAEKLLQTFTKQADGRLPKGALYDLIMQTCHLEYDYDLITYARDHLLGNRSAIAAFAKLAFDAAKANDKAVLALYQEAAKEIALMVNTLHKNVFSLMPTSLSYIGGVFSADDVILEPLQTYLNKDITLHAPIDGPDIGVIKLLCEQLRKEK